MMIPKFGLIALFAIGLTACSGDKLSKEHLAVMELPHWTQYVFESPSFQNSYDFDTSINPFYINADVNGDTTLDIAVVIVERASGRRGVAVLQHNSDSLQIFGAGNKNTIGGNNWNWLVGWKAEERLTAGSAIQNHVGTAFILYTDKGKANWIYWNGKEWEWVEQ